jgi:hypothetical protein
MVHPTRTGWGIAVGLLWPILLSLPRSTLPTTGCVHRVAGRSYNLASWRGVKVVGNDTSCWQGHCGGGGTYNLSLCGPLAETCRDSLTGVRMPPGMLYKLFDGEQSGTCWDVLARWEHFTGARPLPLEEAEAGGQNEGGGGHLATGREQRRGLVLGFSRAGDAHIACANVSVAVALRCDVSAAQDSLEGSQVGCEWRVNVTTAHASICGDAVDLRGRRR